MFEVVGEVIDEMIKIGSDRERARAFFDTFVRETCLRSGLDEEQARARVSENLGYLMGYAPTRIDVKVWQEIGCMHPVFGDLTNPISAEDAFRKGLEMADRNRVAAFDRRLGKIQEAAEALGKLLKEEHDPMFGTVASGAIEAVNETFELLDLPVRVGRS